MVRACLKIDSSPRERLTDDVIALSFRDMIADSNELVASLRCENEELKTANERLACERNEHAQKIELLTEQLNDLLRRLWGRKSERFEHPDQAELDLGWPESEEPEPSPEKLRDLERVEYSRKRPQKRGAKPLPEHLERIDVPVDPSEAERTCACCSKDMKRVGEVVTEELDIVPPRFRVKRYVQGKWRCPDCMNRDLQRPLPSRPIQKGRPSPTLLAYLIVSKYADHLPLYRQEQIFKRHGVHLPRSTMDEWFGQLSPLLLAIVTAMKRSFLLQRYLQCDETPMEALEHEERGKKKGKTKKKKQIRRCYAWAYSIPRGEVIYDVTASRSAAGPMALLDGFEGYVQTDGYVGYNDLFRSGRRLRVACMAHIRRKFFEARHALPERIDEILQLIKSLYAVEKESREAELTPEDRKKLRDEKARPHFDALKAAIDKLAPIPTPKSKLGKAVSYAQSQWPSMERYLEDGIIEIDNNHCENAIRPAVLGRKNYLFLGSLEGGGERAKVFYTLVQSAKRLGLDPFAYLSDVIERIASHPASRIDELTPRGWRLARQSTEYVSAGTSR